MLVELRKLLKDLHACQLILDLEARAKTVKGARALLKAGFEYVTNIKGKKIFRKRK